MLVALVLFHGFEGVIIIAFPLLASNSHAQQFEKARAKEKKTRAQSILPPSQKPKCALQGQKI